jgi:hypothetical protein
MIKIVEDLNVEEGRRKLNRQERRGEERAEESVDGIGRHA